MLSMLSMLSSSSCLVSLGVVAILVDAWGGPAVPARGLKTRAVGRGLGLEREGALTLSSGL